MKLVSVPLSAFTSPTGTYTIDCDCRDEEFDEWDDEFNCKCLGEGVITIQSTPSQRKSSNDKRITSRKHYLAKYHGNFYSGQFTKQWYGWNLSCGFGCGIQLNNIEQLWEITR